MININVTSEEASTNEEKPAGNVVVREVKSWARAILAVLKIFLFTAFIGFAFGFGALNGLELWAMLP